MCEIKPQDLVKPALLGGMIGGGAGALTAGAGAAAQQAFSTPEAPPLQATPAAPAPVMDTEAIARERKLALAKMLALGGRSSTILSQPTNSGTLG